MLIKGKMKKILMPWDGVYKKPYYKKFLITWDNC